MTQQVFYEDVSEGMEIPSLEVNCDLISQVKWSCADGQFNRIHWDREYALSIGLPDVIVAGRFKIVLIARMVVDWIGEAGSIRKISFQHRGMDKVGDPIALKGVVKKREKLNGEPRVECEVWAENPRGEKTVIGTALIILPSKSK